METTYKERTDVGATECVIGKWIYELRNDYPIYRKGLKQRQWEIEMDFKDSNRKWIVKLDTLEDGSKQLIIIKSKF